MKFVYVLTSSNSDCYYEQFLLSAASLRLFNPNAHIVVLIDSKTKENLIFNRDAYEKIVSEIQVISLPLELSQKKASRWIKTSIPHFVPGAFLYIDCDTIVADSLSFSHFKSFQIGAVLDNHVTLDIHSLSGYFRKEDAMAGFSSSIKSNCRFNGGVIFCDGSSQALEFYDKWHSLWMEGVKKNCSQDMPSLNEANIFLNNFIYKLPGSWNCQISHNGLPFLSEAKIIHYYATSLSSLDPAFILASPETFQSIKENGTLSQEILMLLERPKTAFRAVSRIVSDKPTIDALDRSILFKLIRFNNRNPGLKNKLDALFDILTRKKQTGH
jgi:lipopolysaccharide biosynthesis glycosyltransferase